MKIITRAVFQMTPDGYELLEEDSHEYNGPVAEAKGGSGNTTTSSEPPKSLQPAYNQYGQLVTDAIGNQDQLNKPFFPDQTFANLDPRTLQGLNAMAGSVTDPNSGLNQAQNYYSDVAGGKYLGLNPAFSNAVMDPAIQQVNSMFGSAGRTGSSYNQNQAMEAGMRALAPFYGQERQMMGQAAGALPQLEAQGFQRMLGAGNAFQQQNQLGINEAMARYNYDPQMAYLQQAGALLAPGSQYSVTTSQQPGGNPFAGAAGGALAGASIGSAFPGVGTGIGAAIGGGMGLLGGLL